MPESQSRTQSEKYPKRLWLAGPAPYVAQETIIVDSLRTLKFEGGSVVVESAEEEATVRKALEGRVFDEDLKKPQTFKRTGWSTLSQDAFNAHVNIVEG